MVDAVHDDLQPDGAVGRVRTVRVHVGGPAGRPARHRTCVPGEDDPDCSAGVLDRTAVGRPLAAGRPAYGKPLAALIGAAPLIADHLLAD